MRVSVQWAWKLEPRKKTTHDFDAGFPSYKFLPPRPAVPGFDVLILGGPRARFFFPLVALSGGGSPRANNAIPATPGAQAFPCLEAV